MMARGSDGADRDGLAGRLDGIEDGFGQAGRTSAAFDAELGRLRQSMQITSREVGSLASGLEGGLRRAFSGVATDGMKLSDALKGVARSMLDNVLGMVTKPVEQALAGTLAQGVAGMLGGAAGGFAQARVMPFAKGGVVSAPTTFPMRGATGLMGEAGPEAIMPLTRGPDGRLGVASASSGARPVNVTVNVTTPDVAGFSRSRSQIAAELGRALSRGNRNG